MIHALARKHPSIYGTPVLERVDTEIFEKRYFGACMDCDFCRDSCCSYGVDVDLLNHQRILQHADGITRFTGIAARDFFAEPFTVDPGFPGGSFVRTKVVDGHCVFLNRAPGTRGCHLHAYCLHAGMDYHELKPMVSSFCPITFDEGLLHAMEEVDDQSLVCLEKGPSLYRGIRDELRHYFGPDLIRELDALEAQTAHRS